MSCHQAGAVADQSLLLDYIDLSMPDVRPAIMTLGGSGTEPALVALRWFVCLFTNPFTPSFASRVWDAYFFEGPKVLFRTALALMRSAKRRVLSAPHFSDVMVLLEGLGSRILSPSDLLLFFGAGGDVPGGAVGSGQSSLSSSQVLASAADVARSAAAAAARDDVIGSGVCLCALVCAWCVMECTGVLCALWRGFRGCGECGE